MIHNDHLSNHFDHFGHSSVKMNIDWQLRNVH